MSARRESAARNFGPDWLWSELKQRLPGRLPGKASLPPPKFAVALSGGSDSVALLACAAEVARVHRLELRAIHVNHGLQTAAGAFVEFCRALCGTLSVVLSVLDAQVETQRGDSLEARAREARYAAFAAALDAGEILLLAQHADDQLETVLLQLLRGSGVAGLAAMAPEAACGRGRMLRPLLGQRRAALEAWRRERGLEALDDPMNTDVRFDRSFLRQAVLPQLLARWPGAPAAVGRSARHAAEAQSLLDGLAVRDLAALRDGDALDAAGVRALAPPRRRNALRGEIARLGLPVPDTARLREICGPLLDARPDASPTVEWPGVRARRELGRLFFEPTATRGAPRAADMRSAVLEWDWHRSATLDAEPLQGVLRLETDRHGTLDLDRLPATLLVRMRAGGERLRLHRGGPRRSVKALLNEARIPQEARAALPLVYAGEQLIAVSDRWLDASVRVSAQTRRRGRLSWRFALPSDRPLC